VFCLSGAFGSPSRCCLMGPVVVAGTREGAELSILITERVFLAVSRIWYDFCTLLLV